MIIFWFIGMVSLVWLGAVSMAATDDQELGARLILLSPVWPVAALILLPGAVSKLVRTANLLNRN